MHAVCLHYARGQCCGYSNVFVKGVMISYLYFIFLYRLCYYTTESLLLKQNFLRDIRSTFGAGGFVCSLSEKELSEFHQHMERGFPFDDPARVKQGLECAGRQPNSSVWVLNKHLHIDEDGNQMHQSQFAWQPIGGPCIELAGKNAQTINLESSIELPLQSAVPLHNLLKSVQSVLKHNFIPGMLTV